MPEGTQLRWIAKAEAGRFHDFALVQRAEAEPCLCIVYDRKSPGLLDRRRARMRSLLRTVAGHGSLAVDTALAFARSLVGRLKVDDGEIHANRVLVTVLFTDIVDSTRTAAEIGDKQWRALLDRHDYVLRHQIRRFRGREIKNLGDGFLATFDTPARAVRCASVIVEALAQVGVSVRCGLHTGEIEQQRRDISGIAVHTAARIAAVAPAGGSLVSRTVRDLVTGSGLTFQDRGIHLLHGLPEEVHLFAIVAVDHPTVQHNSQTCVAMPARSR